MHPKFASTWAAGPESWDGWRVHADRFLEAGDPRGELLHLEHALAVGSGDSDVRAYVDESVELWVEEQDLDPATADALAFLLPLQVRLRPLLARAPHPVRPTLSRPAVHLIATVGVGGSAWVVTHRDAVLAALIAWIDAAFDGVPPPGPGSRTWRQAEAADSYSACGREGDFLGRWQDLPEEEFLDRQWALAHLDGHGLHYYLPALMTFDLRHQPDGHPRDTWITESLRFTLSRAGRGLRDYQRARFEPLDAGQRAAIAAYCAARHDEQTFERWARTLEAAGDWYTAFLGL